MKRDEEIFAALLKELISEFVLHPEAVQVSVTLEDPVCTVGFECHAGDRGKLIGRGGAHFRALTDICKAWAAQRNLIANVKKLADRDGGIPEPYGRFTPRVYWPKDKLMNITERLARLVFRDDTSIHVMAFDHKDDSEVRIFCSSTEPLGLVEAMSHSIGVLIKAAGNMGGRMLTVKVIAQEQPGRQPLSSEH